MPVTCLLPGEILLPRKGTDMTRWACIACDQFTSEPAYWEEVEALVGDAPSAYRMILPENRLSQAEQLIPQIHADMESYLRRGLLEPACENGYILTARTTESGKRLGLVALLDLEAYDFHKETSAPVRATEETIESRIPSRIRIRRGAPLETPHVLLLMNDPEHKVLEPLYERRAAYEKCYDFPLMMGGGSMEGYVLEGASLLAEVQRALDLLDDGGGLQFAVGDGNHSLASAKAWWEEVKAGLSSEEAAVHPARYAMVELVNIHSEALKFAPIHRVVFGADPDELLADWNRENSCTDGGKIRCLYHGGEAVLRTSPGVLEVAQLQCFLDRWLAAHPQTSIDYVHGDDTAVSFAEKENTVVFLLPVPPAEGLFSSVAKGGSLPRKTFSMGQAREKRYYLECRRIK